MTNEGIATLYQFKNRQNSLNPQSAIRNQQSKIPTRDSTNPQSQLLLPLATAYLP